MRLFLTPSGDTGFALKGDDIVSVFRKEQARGQGAVTPSVIALATAQGGRRLDAFDTVLRSLYSQSGFRAVARVPWNDEYAPVGWNHETFGKFNQGRPDVVFMPLRCARQADAADLLCAARNRLMCCRVFRSFCGPRRDRPSRRIIPRSTRPTQRLSIGTIKLATGE
jgi:hypothetical protein